MCSPPSGAACPDVASHCPRPGEVCSDPLSLFRAGHCLAFSGSRRGQATFPSRTHQENEAQMPGKTAVVLMLMCALCS